MYVIGVYSNALKEGYLGLFTDSILLSIIPVLLISFIWGRKIGNYVVQPIEELANNIKNTKLLEKNAYKEMYRDDEIGLVEKSYDLVINRLNDFYYMEIERERRLHLAEVKSLQSQINPHFLFNILDSVKWLAKMGEIEKVEEILSQLKLMLRFVMDFRDTMSTVKSEIELVNGYIHLQKLRYEDKFEYTISVNPIILEYKVPKLILQPLVENAIIQGMESCTQDGIINIHGYIENKDIILIVENNGPPFKENLQQLLKGETQSVGLVNINKRLLLYYGAAYGLQANVTDDGFTQFIVRIPIDTKKEEVY